MYAYVWTFICTSEEVVWYTHIHVLCTCNVNPLSWRELWIVKCSCTLNPWCMWSAHFLFILCLHVYALGAVCLVYSLFIRLYALLAVCYSLSLLQMETIHIQLQRVGHVCVWCVTVHVSQGSWPGSSPTQGSSAFFLWNELSVLSALA